MKPGCQVYALNSWMVVQAVDTAQHHKDRYTTGSSRLATLVATSTHTPLSEGFVRGGHNDDAVLRERGGAMTTKLVNLGLSNYQWPSWVSTLSQTIGV